jgi:hypothetical protein
MRAWRERGGREQSSRLSSPTLSPSLSHSLSLCLSLSLTHSLSLSSLSLSLLSLSLLSHSLSSLSLSLGTLVRSRLRLCFCFIEQLYVYIILQVMNHERYGGSVDMWGVGCIGYEMMTLEFLWERKVSFFYCFYYYSCY